MQLLIQRRNIMVRIQTQRTFDGVVVKMARLRTAFTHLNVQTYKHIIFIIDLLGPSSQFHRVACLCACHSSALFNLNEHRVMSRKHFKVNSILKMKMKIMNKLGERAKASRGKKRQARI